MSKRIVLKSVIAVVMVGFILSVSSCQKEEKKIIGVWKLKNTEVKQFACSDPLVTTKLRPMLSQFFGGTDATIEYEFTNDGKAIIRDKDLEDINETTTYKVNGNKLSVTTNDITQTYDISFPDKKTMQWDLNMDEQMLAFYSMIIASSLEWDEIEVGGEVNITKLAVRVTLKKQ